MFRGMRRFAQQLPEEECRNILRCEPRGVLSLMGDEGYPYGIPMDHWYDEKTGNLYFHGAVVGHKIDAIGRCDKVSYCVMDQGTPREGHWSLDFCSVVVFGRLHPVEDRERTLEICRNLARKFTTDEDYIRQEIQSAGPRVLCLELCPEHISGKRVNES